MPARAPGLPQRSPEAAQSEDQRPSLDPDASGHYSVRSTDRPLSLPGYSPPPLSLRGHSRSASAQIIDLPLTEEKYTRRPVLSDVWDCPVPQPYPRKAVRVHHGMSKPWSFIKSIFYVKGTVIEAIWPQLLLAVLIISAVKAVQIRWHYSFIFSQKMVSIHQILGSVLAFITVFRTNRSYDAYIEGRKLVSSVVSNLRTALMDMYINDPMDGTPETRERLVRLAEEFRRKSNILFAFIRQSAREAKEGFCPSSDLAEQPLSVDNFVYDVTRPRLVDLLTEEELEHYSSMRVTGRPVSVIAEMNLLAYQIISLSKETHVRVNIDQKFQEVLASWNGMLRVVELTIPFAYQHVVNVVMFVFVYSAPFLYVTPSKGWSISDTSLLASVLLGLVFYGMEAMSLKLCNPFGWDNEDHDLEKFGTQFCIDGHEIAKLAGVADPQHYMNEALMRDLVPEPRKKKHKLRLRHALLSPNCIRLSMIPEKKGESARCLDDTRAGLRGGQKGLP